jgi:GNAT superfamily N-acetyltransferase
MPPHYSVQVIEIRLVSDADAPAIARVRRDSWHAAYEGIIPTPIIDRATAPRAAAVNPAVNPPAYRRTLVAEAGEHPTVVGYASFGPERSVATAFSSTIPAAGGHHPAASAPSASGMLTADGLAGVAGELYALYVTPAWWSTGTGRALMGQVLTSLEAEGYMRVVLWVLADNARARRFYERAGFAADGGTNVLSGLGGVLEVRYTRDL